MVGVQDRNDIQKRDLKLPTRGTVLSCGSECMGFVHSCRTGWRADTIMGTKTMYPVYISALVQVSALRSADAYSKVSYVHRATF